MIGFTLAAFAGSLFGQGIPQDSIGHAVSTFDKACLRGEASEASLTALAGQEGWARVSLALSDGRDRVLAYRAGPVLVRLSHYPATVNGADSSPEQSICAVDEIAAGSLWKAKMAAVQVNGSPLGPPTTPDPAVYQVPEGLEVVVWDIAGGSRIHAIHMAARNYLELSINYPTGR